MKLDDLKSRVDYAIELGQISAKDRYTTGSHIQTVHYKHDSFNEYRAASLSLISSLYGIGHTYYAEFTNRCQHANDRDITSGLGILKSIKSEIDNGWLNSVRSLVSAEVFSDFLEMAEYLLNEGYKDPAAVMIGSVLEEHLRQLCYKNGIETHTTSKEGKQIPKKADALNSDLSKKGVYNLLDQKQITAWLDLRNKAAHGKYSEYTQDHVSLMYQGIIGFITRVN